MFVATRASPTTGEADNDFVANGQAFDTLADRLNNSRALMTKHAGQGKGRELIAKDEIGMAKADAFDCHTHLTRARRLDLDGLDTKVSARLMGNGSARYGHKLSLSMSNRLEQRNGRRN
jgi:hypothetical protein